MERIKQMSIKRSLFTIAFVNTAAAIILSFFSIWICVELRSWLAPEGILIEIASDPPAKAEILQPSAVSDIISFFQILLPILIYAIALVLTASAFYKLKLKTPLEELSKATSRIIDNDLDFTIGAISQDELGKLCIAFETMRKNLLANNRELWRTTEERKRLNAAFSHNLRNPVTVIKGSAKLAKKSISQGNTNISMLNENLSRIDSCTNRIEHYVEIMSSIHNLEEIPLERKPVKWSRLASELKSVIAFGKEDSKIQLKFNADEYPGKILIDRSILFQVTENLVSNGLRYAGNAVEISFSITDGKLLLTVTDDGCGFSDKLIKNGIRPFQKGNEDAEHFGIGLYTCKILCQKHGGDITIDNTKTGAAVYAVLEIK